MSDEIENFVLRSVAKKSRLPSDADLATFDYIESGYVDSVGIIKFIAAIEERFDIELSDDEIESAEFRVLGGLIEMIRRKTAG